MPSIEPVKTTAPIQGDPLSGPVGTQAVPLPIPDLEGGVPLDVLSQMLFSLERQNQSSLKLNLEELKAAQGRMEELQRQLAEQLQRALEAARKAKKKKGGWFSRTIGSAVDHVAKIVGKVVEVHKDVLVLPVDVAVSFSKNIGNPEALLQSLRQDLAELSKDSEVEQAVTGFVAGTTKFVGDLMAFQVVLLTALAEGAVQGTSPANALKQQAEELWHSLETNILDNPDFWKVAERLAQAAAVAGAVASGGLALVAVGLVLALEADNRYQFIEEVAGEKAAPWVRLGLAVAATALAGTGSGTEAVTRWIQTATGVVQGAGQAYQGYRIRQEADRHADALKRDADVQQTLHRIQEVHRLIEALIELYEQRSDQRTRSVDASVGLVETQNSTEAALVLPA